jgi:hypothetical protein
LIRPPFIIIIIIIIIRIRIIRIIILTIIIFFFFFWPLFLVYTDVGVAQHLLPFWLKLKSRSEKTHRDQVPMALEALQASRPRLDFASP